MKTELQVAKWHIIKFIVIIVRIISSWKYGIEIFRGQSRRLTEWDNCNVVPAGFKHLTLYPLDSALPLHWTVDHIVIDN